MPQEWKNAILIPLHKKQSGKDCDNYHGIALLSVPEKVLSLILHNRTTAPWVTVWGPKESRNYWFDQGDETPHWTSSGVQHTCTSVLYRSGQGLMPSLLSWRTTRWPVSLSTSLGKCTSTHGARSGPPKEHLRNSRLSLGSGKATYSPCSSSTASWTKTSARHSGWQQEDGELNTPPQKSSVLVV